MTKAEKKQNLLSLQSSKISAQPCSVVLWEQGDCLKGDAEGTHSELSRRLVPALLLPELLTMAIPPVGGRWGWEPMAHPECPIPSNSGPARESYEGHAAVKRQRAAVLIVRYASHVGWVRHDAAYLALMPISLVPVECVGCPLWLGAKPWLQACALASYCQLAGALHSAGW